MRSTLFLSVLLSLTVLACSSSSSTDNSTTDGGTDGVGGDASTRVPKQHRPSPTTCAPSKGSGTTCGGGGTGECATDADCKSGTNGHCAVSGGGAVICRCFYDTCVTDADCSAGGVCACQGSPYEFLVNACANGNCKVDADCGANGYCSPSEATKGCSGGLDGYFCHAAGDECVDDEDCQKDAGPTVVCAYDSTKKHWACGGLMLCP